MVPAILAKGKKICDFLFAYQVEALPKELILSGNNLLPYGTNGTRFTIEKISASCGLEPGTARSVGQRLTY